MTAKEYIKELQNENFQYYIEVLLKRQALVTAFSTQIDKFHETQPTIGLDVNCCSIVLRTSVREVGVDFLKAFGGKWKKTPNFYDKTTIEYKQVMPHPTPLYDGEELELIVTCPPSIACRVVYEDVIVPEHTEKRAKIECGQGETPVESSTVVIDDLIIEPPQASPNVEEVVNA